MSANVSSNISQGEALSNRTVWPLGLSEACIERILQKGSLLDEVASSPLPFQAYGDPPAAASHRRLPFLSLSRKASQFVSSLKPTTTPTPVGTKLLEEKVERMGNLLQKVQASLEHLKEQTARLSGQLVTLNQESSQQEGDSSKMEADTKIHDAFIEAQTQEKQELLRYIFAQPPEERMMATDPQKCPYCKLQEPHTNWVQCDCNQWWHTICLPPTRGKSMQQIKN